MRFFFTKTCQIPHHILHFCLYFSLFFYEQNIVLTSGSIPTVHSSINISIKNNDLGVLKPLP